MSSGGAAVGLNVLGSLEVVLDGSVVPVGGPKQRTVLALLVQAVGRRVSIDELIFGVYGETASSGARRTVQTYVSNLRQELGDAIRGTGDGYVLDLDPRMIDAGRFEHAVHAAASELGREPERAADRLREALALWRGNPYADVAGYEAFEAEIARLQELRMAALEQRIEADLALGRHRELIGELESLTLEHPFREILRAHQLVALYRAGRQSEALAALGQTRHVLAEELGIDPSPMLRQLERRILAQDPTLDLEAPARVERRAILVAELDAETWSADRRAVALTRRDELLTGLVGRTGARIVGLKGTAVFVTFHDVSTGIEAALAVAALGSGTTFRVALDHGDVEVRDDDVTGPPINRVARIVALGHPGQVLLSPEAHEMLATGGDAGWSVTALGRHAISGVDEPMALYQLHGEGLPDRFPPLRPDRVPPAVPRASPAAVPGYELRTHIGSNDISTVYRAYQASIGREVAVRAIRHELAADPAFIRRFEAEGQRVGRLAHPHVLPMLDYWRDPEGAYLVHPLINGGDLRHKMARAGLPLTEAMEILEQVGAALVHAHDHGVVHGRLHPGNVLLDNAGSVFVSDLGLAQMTEGLVATSVHAYSAPEALGGASVGVPVDVYSFGVLALELLDGRPLPQDGPLPLPPGALGDVLSQATATNPDQRHESVSALLDELRVAVSGVTWTSVELTPARNPYKGLQPFSEADAADFHGREALIEEMLEKVTEQRLVAVVGPSGVGKSSAVRAGLIPALRRGAVEGSERWLVTDLFPGSRPFEELEAALRRVAVVATSDVSRDLEAADDGLVRYARQMLPPGSHLLLVVDQFEEVFTQTPDEDTRRRFMDVLATAATDPHSRIHIVVTLRADFFDRPLRYPTFAEVLKRGMVAVRAPSRDELIRCVQGPATGVQVELENRLLDRILTDADRQPGALPLVQQVLADLFETREADLLTLAAYETFGGLQGAIGHKAEELYLGLASDQRDVTRDVFLRLVTVDEGDVDTRRRVQLSELARLGDAGADIDGVLTRFGRHRLLTFDRHPVTRGPTVEVAHEALIREWARLRGWIDAIRDELLERRRIVAASREWEDSGHDPGALLRGARLATAERWQQTSGLPLTDQETYYLTESRRVADADANRSQRRRRRTLAALTGALAVTIAFSAIAVTQRRVAEEQTQLTRARELAGDALLAIDADPERGILLALESMDSYRDTEQDPVPQATAALQAALQASRVGLHLDDGQLSVAASPNGQLLATDSHAPQDRGQVRVVDIEAGEEIAGPAGQGDIGGLAFSPDGTTLAVGYLNTDGTPAVELFEVGTWRPTAAFNGPADSYERVMFTDDGGRHLAAFGTGRQAVVWDIESGEVTLDLPGVHGIGAVPGINAIAVTEGEEQVRIVDALVGTTLETIATPGIVGERVALDSQGQRIAVDSFTGRAVEVWDRDTGTQLAAFVNTSPLDLAWAPDGRVAYTSNDGSIRLTHVGGDPQELVLQGHKDGVTQIAFSPDGATLASVSWAGETRTWDITVEGAAELGSLAPSEGRVWEAVEAAHGRYTVMTVNLPSNAQRIDHIDAGTGDLRTVAHSLARDAHHNAVLAGGLDTVAVFDHDLVAHVLDLPSGAHRLELPPCQSPRTISRDGSQLVVDGRLLCTIVEGSVKLLDPPAGARLRSAVLDAHTGEILRDLGDRPITTASLGPPGTPAANHAAVAVAWETVELHDLDTDRLVGSLEPPGGSVSGISFSDDGQHLVVGTQSGLVTVIDVSAAVQGGLLDDAITWRFTEPARGVVIDPKIADGRLVFGSMAGHVFVYDLDERRLLADLHVEPIGPVKTSFTPDGTALLYKDGHVIRRFELEQDRLVTLARARLTRELTPEECTHYRIHRDPCDL